MAVRVGSDLHLDVPCAGDVALQEETSVAEGRPCLRCCRAKRRRQRRGALDHADAAPATASRSLHDQRVAEAFGRASCRRLVIDRGSAPRCHRHAGPLRELLGGDLVAQRPHRVARRAEKPHALRDHPVGEHGVLRHEPPAGPDRIGTGAAERRDHQVVVEIGADLAGGRGQPHGGVRVAHERGIAIHVGVEHDRPQPGALARAQGPDRTHAAHGRLATVDDTETADGVGHGRVHAKATNRP